MFSIFLGAAALALAQKPAPERSMDFGAADSPIDLSIAYRGSGWTLLQPGGAIRFEKTLLRRDVRVDKARRPAGFRHRTRDFFVGGDLGADTHINNNTLLAMQAVCGTRVTRTSGYTTGLTLGAGANRTFLNHPSWHERDDGTWGRRWFQGQWSAVISVGYEVGWDSQRRRETRIQRGRTTRPPLQHPVQWFVRPTASVLTPWIDVFTPAVHVDIGVRTSFKGWKGVLR